MATGLLSGGGVSIPDANSNKDALQLCSEIINCLHQLTRTLDFSLSNLDPRNFNIVSVGELLKPLEQEQNRQKGQISALTTALSQLQTGAEDTNTELEFISDDVAELSGEVNRITADIEALNELTDITGEKITELNEMVTNVAYAPENYTNTSPDIAAHLAGIDAVLGALAELITGDGG